MSVELRTRSSVIEKVLIQKNSNYIDEVYNYRSNKYYSKRAKVNIIKIIGSFQKINFKLPIGLAILNYFFASGSSTIILYGLSFIIPKYVEGQINKVHATTPWGYTVFAITVLIYAPIMEELFFRGIIFQKLAITKSPVKALLISALIFTVVHFRSDVISLFTIGVILAILYLNTKQLVVPIVCHFFYNLMVTIRSIYWHLFSNIDHTKTMNIRAYLKSCFFIFI